jgi:hypothetical protein
LKLYSFAFSPQSFELAIKVAKDNTLLAYSLVRGKLGSVPASSKADHSDRPLLADIGRVRFQDCISMNDAEVGQGRRGRARACVAWAFVPRVSSLSLLKRIEMALSKKKRVGKRTISAKQVRKTASGRKRRKSDGTQPPKAVAPTSTPAAS